MQLDLKEFRLEVELRPNFLVADATRVDLDEVSEHATCLDEVEEVLRGHLGDDSKQDFRWHGGEQVSCFSFLIRRSAV
jgi:hypothetical protein